MEKFAFMPHAPHQPVTLGLLGQISSHKGHDDAVEALRILGSSYRLVVAGKGEENYVTKLREKAANLPVRFPGFVSLPEFFNTIDVLLVPSWEEPFGIVLLEGMASGIPVISTTAEDRSISSDRESTVSWCHHVIPELLRTRFFRSKPSGTA
jgi:glycosyltransferase involved in cell wall biosynthesis